jgi:hypothetical protein
MYLKVAEYLVSNRSIISTFSVTTSIVTSTTGDQHETIMLNKILYVAASNDSLDLVQGWGTCGLKATCGLLGP